MISILHHFLELDELLIKLYTVWGFEIVSHKIIEEIFFNYFFVDLIY